MDRELRPTVPPSRRDVLITVLAQSDPESRLVRAANLDATLRGLAEAGQTGAEDFLQLDKSNFLATWANLVDNGLIADIPSRLTPAGIEYARLVDSETQGFVAGFMSGADYMDKRHQDC